jgi:two-component system, LytTR family, response regulator
MLTTLSPLNLQAESLSVLLNGNRVYLPFHKILRLEADRNYTWIYLSDGRKILSSRNLLRFQKRLPEEFIRVNKSHIINRCFLLGITEKRYEISLADNSRIPLARRQVKQILEILFPPL